MSSITHAAALKAWATRRASAEAKAAKQPTTTATAKTATTTASKVPRKSAVRKAARKEAKASRAAAAKPAAAPVIDLGRARAAGKRSGGNAATTGEQTTKMDPGVDTMPAST